jgi:hypothetical protein
VYGSTDRPPGKYLGHSFKEFFPIILEFSQPPFHIFSIDNSNNNNNYIICYDNGGNNGGTQTTINYNTSTYDDNEEADKDTAHSIHRTDKINKKWFDLLFNNIDNYFICYYNNGGIVAVAYEDIKVGGPYSNSRYYGIINDLDNWFEIKWFDISNNNSIDTNSDNSNRRGPAHCDFF